VCAGGRCGDGYLQAAGGEACDGYELGGATCMSLGLGGGTLACDVQCQLDTAGCEVSADCGDGIIQAQQGEDCDGQDLGGATCVSRGFSQGSGALGCNAACAFDEAACVPLSADADLSALTVTPGTLEPAFSQDTTSYLVTVDGTVTSLWVSGTAESPWATVSVAPSQPMTLLVGANLVTVTVTAEDGTLKTYTVEVTRLLDYESPNIGRMIHVPAGTFQRDAMASNLSTVRAFRMSEFEITRAQWVGVTGWADPSDPGYSSGMSDPVQQVSWYDAVAFCNRLSLREGLTPVYTIAGVDFSTLTYASIPTTDNATWNAATADFSADGYRLPTEMEWMWAAMGADSANPGATNTTGWAKAFAGSTGSNTLGDYAVFGYSTSEPGRTTTQRTNPVGSKLANELGFHDLSGNVWEWAWDWYGTNYPAGTVSDYRGPGSGVSRVTRGGFWNGWASYCTMAYRSYGSQNGRSSNYGFRVVRP